MPKLSNRLPSYRKHSNGKHAIVVLSGKTHVLGVFGSRASRREYDRLTAEWLQRGRTAEPASINQENPTMAIIMVAYLKHAKAYYVKDGEVTREYGLLKEALQVVKRLYLNSPVDEFGPLALQCIQSEMVKLGWGRKYINKQVGRIVRMFKWAVSKELICCELLQQLKSVEGLRKGRTEAPESTPVLPVPDDVVEKTLPHLTPVVADMVQIQRLTSARPGEICSMRPCDVIRSLEIWEYRPDSHKTEHHERDRIIYIGPKAQEILLPYLLRPRDVNCFSPQESVAKAREKRYQNRKTPLSCGNTPGSNRVEKPKRSAGTTYNTGSYGKAINRGCKNAGVEPWSPNRLRHSAGNRRSPPVRLGSSSGHTWAFLCRCHSDLC